MLKCSLFGNIGQDATLKEFDNNKYLVSFSVASKETYKNEKGEKVERVTWIKCNLWNKGKTLTQHLKKGKQIHLEGTPTANHYTDKEGKEINTIELQIKEIHFA